MRPSISWIYPYHTQDLFLVGSMLKKIKQKLGFPFTLLLLSAVYNCIAELVAWHCKLYVDLYIVEEGIFYF